MCQEKIKVRDKLWIFASRPHDDDPYLSRSANGELVGCDWSRITPAEGAFMLGTPNLIMVSSDGIPVPFSKDAYGYMESFYRLKKVLWSCTGSSGFRNGNEEEFICKLSEKYPNISGGFMDDFTWDNVRSSLRSAEEVKELFAGIRKTLNKACRPMELWATCYVKDIEQYPIDVYDDIDVLTVWNMQCETPQVYINNFELYEKYFPHKRKAMGIYLYDYPNRCGTEIENFKMQCETSLKLLKEGRLDAIIFLTNCTMGIGLESELWLRGWIDKVGEELL